MNLADSRGRYEEQDDAAPDRDAIESRLEKETQQQNADEQNDDEQSKDDAGKREQTSKETQTQQDEQRLPPELTRGGELRYCRRCQEPLSFFATGPWNCWKCGLRFDPRQPRTYLVRRTLLKWKFWFPGFCLSVVAGVLTYGVFLATDQIVAALIVSAPVCLGCLLGYGGNNRARWLAMLLVVAGCGIAGLLIIGNPCVGIVPGVVALIPMGVGMGAGIVLRMTLENSNWDQRWYFP